MQQQGAAAEIPFVAKYRPELALAGYPLCAVCTGAGAHVETKPYDVLYCWVQGKYVSSHVSQCCNQQRRVSGR